MRRTLLMKERGGMFVAKQNRAGAVSTETPAGTRDRLVSMIAAQATREGLNPTANRPHKDLNNRTPREARAGFALLKPLTNIEAPRV